MPFCSSPLLRSAPNFRDLGGYRTACGSTVRHGLLYRSQDFSGLDSADLQRLQNLGIRLICDVRSDSERLHNPNRWPLAGQLDRINLNISADLRASHTAITRLLSGIPTEEHARQAMLVTYQMLPGTFAPRLGQLFERLLAGELPLVFHCAAGKDRTGFIAALLLSALGVPRATIYTDYLLSAQRWHGEASETAIRRYLAPLCTGEPAIDVIRILCGVSPAYLDAAFAVIDQQHGGVEHYLERAGLTTAARQRLQSRLLTD